MPKSAKVKALFAAVSPFFPKSQLRIASQAIADRKHPDWRSNKEYWIKVLEKSVATFENMPKTYQTSSQKLAECVAYLHYFSGSNDWWIVEKDLESQQLQARGAAKFGFHQSDIGFISIESLCNTPLMELDLFWQPKMLKDIPELAEKFTIQTNSAK